MGVTPLRLLLTSAVLVAGAALMPAVSAVAATEPAAVAVHQDRAVAALTQRESALDAAAQHVSDPDGRMAPDAVPQPPVWLLLLLVPILLAGAIGAGITLRRLR